MRRWLTVVIAAAVAVVGAAALVDAWRGSGTSDQGSGRTSESESHGAASTTVSGPRIRLLRSWQGVYRTTVRLGRIVGATWEEVGVLEPGSYALTARIDLPRSTDVDVWFESATGASTIDLLGRGQPRTCRGRQGQDVCVTALDVQQREFEGWRLIVRKISRRPAVLRLRVAFRETVPEPG